MADETINYLNELIKRLTKENDEMKVEQGKMNSLIEELETEKYAITVSVLHTVDIEDADIYLDRILDHTESMQDMIKCISEEASESSQQASDMYGEWQKHLGTVKNTTGVDRYTMMSYDSLMVESQRLSNNANELRKEKFKLEEFYDSKLKHLKSQLQPLIEDVDAVENGLNEVNKIRDQLQTIYCKSKCRALYDDLI